MKNLITLLLMALPALAFAAEPVTIADLGFAQVNADANADKESLRVIFHFGDGKKWARDFGGVKVPYKIMLHEAPNSRTTGRLISTFSGIETAKWGELHVVVKPPAYKEKRWIMVYAEATMPSGKVLSAKESALFDPQE